MGMGTGTREELVLGRCFWCVFRLRAIPLLVCRVSSRTSSVPASPYDLSRYARARMDELTGMRVIFGGVAHLCIRLRNLIISRPLNCETASSGFPFIQVPVRVSTPRLRTTPLFCTKTTITVYESHRKKYGGSNQPSEQGEGEANAKSHQQLSSARPRSSSSPQ